MMRVSLRTSETEDQAERLVDGSELAHTKASRRSAEALRVHHGRLLNENARLTSAKRDRRAEARRTGAFGCGRNEGGAQLEELVCLYDNCIAGAALLMAARAGARREAKDLAADHLSPTSVGPARPAGPG